MKPQLDLLQRSKISNVWTSKPGLTAATVLLLLPVWTNFCRNFAANFREKRPFFDRDGLRIPQQFLSSRRAPTGHYFL